MSTSLHGAITQVCIMGLREIEISPCAFQLYASGPPFPLLGRSSLAILVSNVPLVLAFRFVSLNDAPNAAIAEAALRKSVVQTMQIVPLHSRKSSSLLTLLLPQHHLFFSADLLL
jgi:hypothetical protein